VRMRSLRFVSRGVMAGALIAGALAVANATSASAHILCKDGYTDPVDDPAVACQSHGGVAGTATTEAESEDHDHAAPTTAKKSTTPTTKKPAVKASPAFTG
jgi:hypothetical protein